ncbi:cytochrome P450 [Cyathus striatus]|nr:cytochrome P450 [Cyathus striatus]
MFLFCPLAPTLLVLAFTLFTLLRLAGTSRLAGLPLPPGPRGFTKRVLPNTYPWRVYAKWKELYGDICDIIYIHVFGNPVLVLNSAATVTDLLDKRGSIYSSRPVRTMVVDLIGWDWIFSSMPYGERWKRHRNLFHRHFKPQDSFQYNALQLKETHTLLRNLLSSPDQFRYYVRRTAAAIILNITYGHQVADHGDDYVALADKAISGLAMAGIFGTYVVDYLPWLKHVPIWFPFASFKRQALYWRRTTQEMVNKPYEMVKKRLAEGTAVHCLVSKELDFLTSNPREGEDENIIKNVAATAYAGGADTSVSAILSFFLVMATHPTAQCQAQAELDQVVCNRLPTLSDRDELPLIRSICYELLRWNPVTPLGLAHYLTEHDEYLGYHIPKGTTVLPNVWAILHDENVYPAPLEFKPDRFLDLDKNANDGVNMRPDAAFGFGRRMCPGRWFAYDFIFMVVVSVLSVYNIEKALDNNGNPIEPVKEYTSHLLSHPKPFECRIVPRSPQAETLIRQTCEN